jgi:hypothetical protein
LNIGLLVTLEKPSMTHLYIVVRRKTTGCNAMHVLIDLNLLIIFAVIAEERSATKASARLLLSQPAVSRALQRARSMFQDELVIRSSSGTNGAIFRHISRFQLSPSGKISRLDIGQAT